MKLIFAVLYRRMYFLFHGLKFKTKIMSSSVSTKALIGRRVLIEKGVRISPACEVGDYSYVNRNASIEHAVVGKFCSIGPGVIIAPLEHELGAISTHPFKWEPFYGFVNSSAAALCRAKALERQSSPITIGDDVWVGANAIVLRGARIGTGAVIGAGSVVTKAVPAYEIWAGVPAKKIRDRFSEEVRQAIIESDWSNRGELWIKDNVMPIFFEPERIGLLEAKGEEIESLCDKNTGR